MNKKGRLGLHRVTDSNSHWEWGHLGFTAIHPYRSMISDSERDVVLNKYNTRWGRTSKRHDLYPNEGDSWAAV